jgi:hypothetical protein
LKVLMIADDPEALAFDQIIGLRKAVQELVGKIDLLVFSADSIFFDQKKISEKGDTNARAAQETAVIVVLVVSVVMVIKIFIVC